MSLDSTPGICRICLETKQSYFSLHKTVPIGEEDILMSQILIYCGNVEVSHDDRKPQNACFACIENAKVAYRFKMLCMQSETTLNTKIFITECDSLKFKEEEDIIDISDMQIHNVKEEQPYLINVEDCSEDRNDYDNDQLEDSNNCFVQQESKNEEKTEKCKYNCSDCGKSFQYRYQMLKHCCTNDNSIKCCYCDFKATANDLRWHVIRTHNDRKTIKCHHCDKRFFKEDSLKQHIIINHSDIKNLVCGVCGKVFKWAVSLRNHMLRHSGEPLYSCTLCDKKFYRKSDSNVHMNMHTRQKVFKCDVCSREFYRKGNLRLHLRTHTGEKPHVCDVCKNTFTQGYSLRRHKKLYHPDT